MAESEDKSHIESVEESHENHENHDEPSEAHEEITEETTSEAQVEEISEETSEKQPSETDVTETITSDEIKKSPELSQEPFSQAKLTGPDTVEVTTIETVEIEKEP